MSIGVRRRIFVAAVAAAVLVTVVITTRTDTSQSSVSISRSPGAAAIQPSESDESARSNPSRSDASRSPTPTGSARLIFDNGIPLRYQHVLVQPCSSTMSAVARTDGEGRLSFDCAADPKRVRFELPWLPSRPSFEAQGQEDGNFGTTVVGTDRAGVIVELNCVDRMAHARLECGATLRVPPTDGPSVQSWTVEGHDGAAQAAFELPPDAPFVLYLKTEVFSQTSSVQTARDRTWTVFTTNACEICEWRATVVDLPAEIDLQGCVSIHEFGRGAVRPWTATHSTPHFDSKGQVTCWGRFGPNECFAAFVSLAVGRPVPLRADTGGSRLACGEQILAPSEPVVGIKLLSAAGEDLPNKPFALRETRTETKDLIHYVSGTALIRESSVSRPGAVTAVVPDYGEFSVDPSSLRRVGAGTFGLALPARDELGAIEVQSAGEEPGAAPHLRIRASGGSILSEDVAHAAKGKLIWSFTELVPGNYDVLWSWGEGSACERRLACGVEVKRGETHRIETDAPQVSQRAGHFSNWDALSVSLRPTGVSIEGQYAEVDAGGSFRIVVASPLRETADVYLPRRMSVLRDVARIGLSGDGESLSAELVQSALSFVPINIARCSDLEYAVEYWAIGEVTRSVESPWGSTLIRSMSGEPLAMACGQSEAIVGCLWEWDSTGAGRSRLMAFFRASAADARGKEVNCGGRWLALKPSHEEHELVEVAALWRSSPEVTVAAPLGRFSAIEGARVWIPNGTDALRLIDTSGLVRELAIAREDTSVMW